MKKRGLLLMGLLFISPTVMAYALNGTVKDEGGGRYSVILQSDYDEVYTGVGVDQGDGTMKVTVHSQDGATYEGVATDYGDGEYQLDLKNTVTGVLASGSLEEEEPES